MADSRHKHAAPRPNRRAPRTSRSFGFSRAVLPAGGLLAIGGVVAVVALQGGASPVEAGVAAAAPQKDLFAASVSEGQAPATVSRSAERPPLPNVAAVEKKIEGLRYATSDLEIHAAAKKSSPVLASVASGDTVEITGKTKGEWAEIVHKDLPRWVKSSLIANEMPLGTAPCPVGSEGGLQPDTVKVLRAVCAKFPSITSYGGIAGRGEHATGHALDIMVGTGNPIGNDIALFLQENRAELGIEYLIWRQRIWRPATSAAWRGMSNRGGATANHLDHVHVTTYGSSATR